MADTMAAPGTKTHKAAKRYIYAWGAGKAEGNGNMKDLLGGKGAGLAEMTNAGLPTPPGFTITTEACNDYFAIGKELPAGLWDDVLRAMEQDSGQASTELRVDGGAAANNLLMQFQADLLGVPVVRPKVLETTALGAAYLAGLTVGMWASEKEIAALAADGVVAGA